MIRGTLLILGHGIKGQGQLWHSVYKTLWAGYRLQFLPDHFQTSHVSCGWWGGTLLILGHRVKGQGQLWHSVYKTLWAGYRLQFFLDHFQTSHVSCGWWEEEPMMRGGTLFILGQRVKMNFAPPLRWDATLCVVYYKFRIIIFSTVTQSLLLQVQTWNENLRSGSFAFSNWWRRRDLTSRLSTSN